ncbi:hypothetical protein [Herbaspirillum sp. SJZ107]|uniref:hypothetical protein n=1 Tax=Herbaspirillum sp. SJZ107 TaxID=2572881 RepID=UPI001152D833|nr:hypothetical protein [Herbaspirillum sp. SJZ107]TQK07007.1 hypothetical protein FBX97_2275 [Herbaspirillum sp. SJZ107]
MSIRRFFVTQLLPALDDFRANSSNRDIDHGTDVAIAARLAGILNSLPERVMLEIPQPLKTLLFRRDYHYRESTWRECPAYEYVCDFAIAYKHETVSRPGRKIDRLEKAQPRAAYCIYRDSSGEYHGTQKLLWLKLLSGESVDLRRALMVSVAYWVIELFQFGFIELIDPNRFAFSENMSRAEAEAQPNLRLHQIAGEQYGNLFHVLEYDYETGFLRVPGPGTAFEISKNFDLVFTDSPFTAA